MISIFYNDDKDALNCPNRNNQTIANKEKRIIDIETCINILIHIVLIHIKIIFSFMLNADSDRKQLQFMKHDTFPWSSFILSS